MGAAAEDLSQVMGQGPDIGPGRTGCRERDVGGAVFAGRELRHGDRDRREGELLVGPGPPVDRLPAQLLRGKTGRRLEDVPFEGLHSRLDRVPSGEDGAGRRGRASRRVVGIGRVAQPDQALVDLFLFGEEGKEARGLADGHEKDSRRVRVQGPAVADAARSEEPAHPLDDVVGGEAAGLVDDEQTVVGHRFARQRAGPEGPPAAASRRPSTVAGTSRIRRS